MNNEQLKQIFEDNAETIVTESENIEAMTESKFIEVVSKLLSATNNAESMAMDSDAIKAIAERESIIEFPIFEYDSEGAKEFFKIRQNTYARGYIKGAKDILKLNGK